MEVTEKTSPSKPSVAELAGRFKGHVLPMPTSNEERPFRRRPPSLKLQHQKDENEESEKPIIVSPKPFKIKMKNSPIIEKLQANLALSPTTLLPSPKSPELKQPVPLPPAQACSPLSPEEENAVSFESPPEGAPLQSFNKTRARLSFKRRPPTRQHRRSAGEEAGACGGGLSPCEQSSPGENGDRVFDNQEEEAHLKEPEGRSGDCEKTGDEVAEDDPARRDVASQQVSVEQEAEQAQTSSQALEEGGPLSEPFPAKPIGGSNTEEEEDEIPQEAPRGEEKDRV